MTTEDIILHIFYLVAISLPAIPQHSQAKLYPSELVTIGILFDLKGGYFRAFYRWLERDYNVITVIGLVMAHCLNELGYNVYSRLISNGVTC